MSILDELYERRKRLSPWPQFWRFLGKAVLATASLVPIGVIAWKLKSVRRPPLPGVAQQVDTISATTLRDESAVTAHPEKLHNPPAVADDRTGDPAPPQPPHSSHPLPKPLSQESSEEQIQAITEEPIHIVKLAMRRRGQIEDVPLNVPRLAYVANCPVPHVIEPSHGTLPATVRIGGSNGVRLVLMIPAPGQVEIKALISTATADDAPFTADSMKRMQLNIAKRGRAAVKQLAALQTERERLKLWVESPILKPLEARGKARARVLVLDTLIPAKQQEVTEIDAQLATANSLHQLALQLDQGCELHFEESDVATSHPQTSTLPAGYTSSNP